MARAIRPFGCGQRLLCITPPITTFGIRFQKTPLPMLRQHLIEKRVPTDRLYRWRGGEVSRLEGLSDGVFAVTLTLLIVAQSVPSTFYELWLVVRDLPVFLVCFLALMQAWALPLPFFPPLRT